jgi:hypothetical protein
MRVIGAWGIAALAVLLAGCISSTRPAATGIGTGNPATDAATILATYRATPAADAVLSLRVKPAKGDALSFQLHLWCAPDGRVRIIASRLDVDFCSAVLGPDGSYRVVLPRAHLAAVGTFGDAERHTLSPLLTHPALIADELRSGPLPPDGPWRAGDEIIDGHPTLSATAAAGVRASATWDPATGLVTDKTLLVLPGEDGRDGDLIRIAYSHERDFDGLQRPTRAVVGVPGPDISMQGPTATTVTIGLKSFDGLGSISDERMHLDVPADARTVPLDELLKHLGD